MKRAAFETNANQRKQFIASFRRVKGRKPSPNELAAFDARHLERGFISNNFSSGFSLSSTGTERGQIVPSHPLNPAP